MPCTSIPRGLQQIAVAEGALAIVAGPSQRGPLGRLVQGSIGERLLRGAPCPIVVATGGCRHDAHEPIARIGVGYVATPEGDEALRAAAGLAARARAEVRVLSVVEPPAVSAGRPFGWRTSVLESTAREELATHIHSVGAWRSPARWSTGTPTTSSHSSPAKSTSWSAARPATARSAGCRPASCKARSPLLLIPRGARNGFATLGAPTPVAA